MAGTASNVKIGVCWVKYGNPAVDLGYTSGGVSVAYSTETQEVTVDQETNPIKELLTKQTFEVTVPLAEYNLNVLANIFPDSEIVSTGDTDVLRINNSVVDLFSDTDMPLVLTPVDGDEEEVITIANAMVVPNFEFSFTKEGARIYEVTFRAATPNGTEPWVKFGTGNANS